MSRLTLATHDAEPEITVVASDLLGPLNVPTKELLTFPSGLLGFPECRRFALVRASHDGMFWLQSQEYSTLVFLMVDPFRVVDEYTIEVGPSQLGELGPYRPSDIAMLAIVTLPGPQGGGPTANLQGPVAVNFATRTGKQIIISDTEFGVRCAIDLDRLVK